MKIFTIAAGSVKTGGEVVALPLASGAKVPAVTVGEEGRGRKLGVLPVTLLPESKALWDSGKNPRIKNVRVGETHAGLPKLIEIDDDGDTSHAVIILATPAGFRGSNSHGEMIMWGLDNEYGWKIEGLPYTTKARFRGELIKNPEIEKKFSQARENSKYLYANSVEEFVERYAYTFTEGDLPGKILVRGEIAQGMAGRAGGGSQYILVVPRGARWAIKMTGRLYGSPSAYEYFFDGVAVTPYTARDLEML